MIGIALSAPNEVLWSDLNYLKKYIYGLKIERQNLRVPSDLAKRVLDDPSLTIDGLCGF